MRYLAIYMFVAVTIHAAPAIAVVTGVTGIEERFWESYSVVYAQVTGRESDNGNGKAVLRLSVFACISGRLDAADKGELLVDVQYSEKYEPVVPRLPATGSKVIALVERRENGSYWIPHDYVGFMPKRSPIFDVKSFDDPDVQKLILGLRKIRKIYDKLEAERREEK